MKKIILIPLLFLPVLCFGDVYVGELKVSTISYIVGGSTTIVYQNTTEQEVLAPLILGEQLNTTTLTTYQTGTEVFNSIDLPILDVDTTAVKNVYLQTALFVKGSTSSVQNTGYARMRIRIGADIGATTGGTFYYLTKSTNSDVIDGYSTNSDDAYVLENSTNTWSSIGVKVDIKDIIDLVHIRFGISLQYKSLNSGLTASAYRPSVFLKIKY